jgi:hypothetical protein
MRSNRCIRLLRQLAATKRGGPHIFHLSAWLLKEEMTQSLYPRFLDDPEEYKAAEQFWRDMLEEIAVTKGSGGEWGPWIWRGSTYFDGTPHPRYDDQANPMFAALNDRTARAVHVIQWRVEATDISYMGGWVSLVESERIGEGRIIAELTLNLGLTVESAEVARDVLSRWLDEAVSVDEVKRLIDEISEANARTD